MSDEKDPTERLGKGYLTNVRRRHSHSNLEEGGREALSSWPQGKRGSRERALVRAIVDPQDNARGKQGYCGTFLTGLESPEKVDMKPRDQLPSKCTGRGHCQVNGPHPGRNTEGHAIILEGRDGFFTCDGLSRSHRACNHTPLCILGTG